MLTMFRPFLFAHRLLMFARKVLNIDRNNLNRVRRLMRAFTKGSMGCLCEYDQQNWLMEREMALKKMKYF
jgi:hypothetical protein